MKKLLVVLLLSVLSLPSLFSQAIKYDIKVKYNKDATGTADITVMVKEGNASFTYFLMTNDPMNGEVLEQAGPERSKSHVFRDVKPGKYFIKIEDQMGLPAGKTVEIQSKESSSN